MIKKILRHAGFAVLNLVVYIVSTVAIATVLMNLMYAGINYETNSMSKKIAPNPGLNNGFIPQGLTWNSTEDYIATVGYIGGHKASRLYVIKPGDKNPKEYYELYKHGEPYFGHTGGLQYHKGKFYLANEGEGIYVFDADFIGKGNTIEVGDPIKVNNHSSFIFADDDYFYVGEFNNDKNYVCTNEVIFNGERQRAIIAKYADNDFTQPVAVYSIPNWAQGVAFKDGNILISTSYFFHLSKLLYYTEETIVDTGRTYQGAPLYFLGKPTKTYTEKPMTEDLDLYKGKVMYHSEVACTKYMYGKFLFSYYIKTLDLM